jgi:hypothetical protein
VEIRTKALLDGLKYEEEAITRSYKNRIVSVREYVLTLENIEADRHFQVLYGLELEAKQAEKLRDPNARGVAIAEVAAKAEQERNQHLREQAQLTELITSLTRPRVALAENAAQAAERERIALSAIVKDLGGGSVVFRGEATRERQVTGEATRPRIATIEGLEKNNQQLTGLKALIEGVKDSMVGFSDFISGTFKSAIGEMAGALAQGIEAWALYGESLGKALRKALAASLAHIAADAAIQAIYHLAFALGKLAFGDGAGAARHFIAAAQFGAVAAAAGVGARLVAGNAFQSSGAGSTTGASSGSSGGSTSGTQASPKPRDVNRNSIGDQATEIHVHISGEAAAAFDYKVVEAISNDIEQNGKTRAHIKKESQS